MSSQIAPRRTRLPWPLTVFVGTALVAQLAVLAFVLPSAPSGGQALDSWWTSYAKFALAIGTVIAQVWGLLLSSAAVLGWDLAQGRRRAIVIAAPGAAALALALAVWAIWAATFRGDPFAAAIGVSGIIAALAYSALSWLYTPTKAEPSRRGAQGVKS